MATLKRTASKLQHEGRDQKHAEPHGQAQPTPNANTAPPAAAAIPPAPAAIALRPSGSRDSSSSSSTSWSTSMPEEYGTLDSTSTSTSTATLRSGGRGKRRHSHTAYPGRRKGSTDTGTETEPQDKRGTKFWIYTVVATTLVIATTSAIGMSLRATEAATPEPPEYTLPKGVTVTAPTAPKCNCATASPGSPEAGRRRRHSKTESPDELAASGGNASDVERLDDEKGEDAVPDDGVPQKKVAGKATRSLVAFKIGPGRPKNVGESATSPKPAIRNRTSARKTSKPRARRREQPRSAKKRATIKNAAGKSTASATSRTSPPGSTKTVESFVQPEVNEAADWERERPLVNAERRSSNAAAKPSDGTEKGGALNAAARHAAGTAAFTKRRRRGSG
ncbi:uncharacterized protein LOC119165016 [Rhipicephalus microplus]|uniref:uncharacterized protein LOC119165016 n=1 Tax=Rhipicephalus microplus TaxID=6941 RepID=UPI003F6C8EC6